MMPPTLTALTMTPATRLSTPPSRHQPHAAPQRLALDRRLRRAVAAAGCTGDQSLARCAGRLARLSAPMSRGYAAIGVPLDPHWNLSAYDVRQQGATADPATAS